MNLGVCGINGNSTKNFTENPYLCEVGTFLDLRTRVNQMKQSGQLLFEMKKKFAQSQVLDDRLIDNDVDFEDSFDEYDEIDKFNASADLADKLAKASSVKASEEAKADEKNLEKEDSKKNESESSTDAPAS